MAKLLSLETTEEITYKGRFSDGSDRQEHRTTVHTAVVLSDGERHTLRFEGREPTLQEIADAVPVVQELPARSDGRKDRDELLAEVASRVESIDTKVETRAEPKL